METKICTKCKETKTLDNFWKSNGKSKIYCKSCCMLSNRQTYAKRKTKIDEILKLNQDSKVCTRCGEIKPINNFLRDVSNKTGKANICKSCRKNTYLKTLYKIDVIQYNKMLEEQDYKCAICKEPETSKDRTGNIRNLAVDHCHRTGKVRRLLCSKCNTTLGKYKEDIRLFQNFINYIKEFNDTI